MAIIVQHSPHDKGKLGSKTKRNDNKDPLRSLYQTYKWKKLTKEIKSFYVKDLYIEHTEGRLLPVQTVHHIKPITRNKDDLDRFYEWEGLIPLSMEGHKKVHKLYEQSPQKRQETIELLQELVREYNENYYLDTL